MYDMRSIYIFAALLFLLGCSDDTTSSKDRDADSFETPCSEQYSLTIGQCIDDETQAPCLDHLATQRSWLSIAEQPIIAPIIGLQGSPMFVMSVQGEGIDPGTESDSPRVELEVSYNGMAVGNYTSRPSILPLPNSSNGLLAPQLYVVVFLIDDLIGKTLDVKAVLRDRNGTQWCKEESFQVGELIDTPGQTH